MKNCLFILPYFISALLYANGGPIDGSNLYRFGVITPTAVKEVALKKELLIIKLEGDYSNVTVLYTLQNSGEARRVQYGFPVDWDESSETMASMGSEAGRIPPALKPVFSIFDGSTKLPVIEKTDTGHITEKQKTNKQEVVSLALKRIWYLTELSFTKDETKEILVSYRMKNSFIDWETSKSCFIDYSDREMSYDFRPAKNWGSAKINDFEVIVDASEIIRNYGTCNVTGLPEMLNRDGKLVFSKKSVDLSDLTSLTITYDNSIQNRSKEILLELVKPSTVASVKVTSELMVADSIRIRSDVSYSANKLLDRDFSTAWAEGAKGPGIGESIEIEIKKGHAVAGIAIINGYTKSRDAYYNNNRIKTLQFDCILPDDTIDKDYSRTINLMDLPYSEIDMTNFAQMLSLVNSSTYGYEFKKIKLTIKDVYPGKKFNDTCVSE